VKSFSLTFKAGSGALESVRKHGFDTATVGTIAGASGGAKWLVLSQLDRAILTSVVPKLDGPVHLIGSSIGSWRFACYAQDDPIAAIDRFEKAYLEQSYSEDPDIHEITAKSREIIGIVLGQTGISEILNNPLFRTHVMAVRSRHIMRSENRAVLAFGLLTMALLNAANRSTLGWSFERALFYDQRDMPPFFDATGFPLQRVILTEENLEDAIVATGSIPLVLSDLSQVTSIGRSSLARPPNSSRSYRMEKSLIGPISPITNRPSESVSGRNASRRAKRSLKSFLRSSRRSNYRHVSNHCGRLLRK
jgi:hypothetical protein